MGSVKLASAVQDWARPLGMRLDYLRLARLSEGLRVDSRFLRLLNLRLASVCNDVTLHIDMSQALCLCWLWPLTMSLKGLSTRLACRVQTLFPTPLIPLFLLNAFMVLSRKQQLPWAGFHSGYTLGLKPV